MSDEPRDPINDTVDDLVTEDVQHRIDDVAKMAENALTQSQIAIKDPVPVQLFLVGRTEIPHSQTGEILALFTFEMYAAIPDEEGKIIPRKLVENKPSGAEPVRFNISMPTGRMSLRRPRNGIIRPL